MLLRLGRRIADAASVLDPVANALQAAVSAVPKPVRNVLDGVWFGVDGAICAIAARCTHLGGPLDEGKGSGNTVTCPWHGSEFDLCTGDVLSGPAVFPQPVYETLITEGRVELRPRPKT